MMAIHTSEMTVYFNETTRCHPKTVFLYSQSPEPEIALFRLRVKFCLCAGTLGIGAKSQIILLNTIYIVGIYTI